MSRRFERIAPPGRDGAVSLKTLLPGCDLRGGDVHAGAVTCDSRQCRPGDVFVAIPGVTRDGHQHVDEAIRRGAAAVVVEHPQKVDCPQGVVADSRAAYASVCQALAGEPSSALTTVGVTGTNGKTTTSVLLRSVLETAGHRTGLSGTLFAYDGRRSQTTALTTPDSADLARWLAACRDHGCSHAVMELSSHALEQRRAWGIGLDVAVVTNVTRDHLDYHGTPEAYADAKARIFELLKRDAVAVINADDPGAAALADRADREVIRYGMHAIADVTAAPIGQDLNGQRFELRAEGRHVVVRSSLLGAHNLSNCLATAAVGLHLGVSLEQSAEGISAVAGVRGRLERVDAGQPFAVFVDYAHTEDALRRCLNTLGALVAGRLICVFGAGGDRDREKRPLMGRAVQLGADLAVLTSDNPRTEDPRRIIDDVLSGMRERGRMHVEPDRRTAIQWALAQAGSRDCVLIAGKGHETYQILGESTIHFDDRQVASEWLEAHGGEAVDPQPVEVG